MSGRILLVDTIATNRILLRVKLMAAQYEVEACATLDEARATLASAPPDLVIADVTAPGEDGIGFCAGLRADPEYSATPIIATGFFSDPAQRMEALRAGVDDVLDKRVTGALLQARIRSLLRARDAAAELRLREDTQRALGFAEDTEDYATPDRIAVVSSRVPEGGALLAALSVLDNTECVLLDPGEVLQPGGLGALPDLFVIDGAGGGAGAPTATDVYRLVAELRSRSETRHAAQLVILPADPGDMAAMVLDLGANDLASTDVCDAELAHRARALLRLKSQQDRLRDTVRNGLQAAVTDPLTGLYNRRYALPHLAKLAERARGNGRCFAVMALDIDHFKVINDSHGHAAGDRVLVEVARRLRDNLRAVDLVARIGGEEFLVAMPDTTAEQAQGAAERLRRIIEDTPFDTVAPGPTGRARRTEGRIGVTLSIGVALGHPDIRLPEEIDVIVHRADEALYDAKNAGRNTVTVSRNAA